MSSRHRRERVRPSWPDRLCGMLAVAAMCGACQRGVRADPVRPIEDVPPVTAPPPEAPAQRTADRCDADGECAASACGCECLSERIDPTRMRSCPYCPSEPAPCADRRAVCGADHRCTFAVVASTPACASDDDCNYAACGCGCQFFPPNVRVRCPSCPSGPPACASRTAVCARGHCALR